MPRNHPKNIEEIVFEALNIAGSPPSEVEKACWIAVHLYTHGFPPAEYDIREIDEDLYLSVLETVKKRIESIDTF